MFRNLVVVGNKNASTSAVSCLVPWQYRMFPPSARYFILAMTSFFSTSRAALLCTTYTQISPHVGYATIAQRPGPSQSWEVSPGVHGVLHVVSPSDMERIAGFETGYQKRLVRTDRGVYSRCSRASIRRESHASARSLGQYYAKTSKTYARFAGIEHSSSVCCCNYTLLFLETRDYLSFYEW